MANTLKEAIKNYLAAIRGHVYCYLVRYIYAGADLLPLIQGTEILGSGLALSVMVGGRGPGRHDATNDLTYLCLAARLATRLVYPDGRAGAGTTARPRS